MRRRAVLRRQRQVSWASALAPALAAAATAELAARLLEPRPGVPRAHPADAREHFSDEEIERGARFARPLLALGLGRSAVELASLTALVRRPPRTRNHRHVAEASAAAAALSVLLSLPALPLAALARRRAIAVGLVTQSWRGWAVDLVKANGIQALFAGGAGGAIVFLTRRYPRVWWLPAAGGSVAFGAVLAALAPVLLDPLFNDFEPLPEGETRADVLELARVAGVQVGEVYSVDASRRTTAANAYVTGLGPTKRVVLFDTLLRSYGRDEIRVVVAHELAHVRHRDVLRSVAFAAAVAPVGALAVQRFSWLLCAEADRGTAAALPALALAAAVVSAPIGLLGNRLSRAVERRADAFSLELSRAPGAFIAFERRIALQNVADVRPPRWLSVLATHPPTLERIAAAA